MSQILKLMSGTGKPEAACEELSKGLGVAVYLASVAKGENGIYAVAKNAKSERRAVRVTKLAPPNSEKTFDVGEGYKAYLTPADFSSAVDFQKALPGLKPVPLGLSRSAGLGDRLGLATPGHVKAIRGTGIRPIFAQQSIREMSRTGRTPKDVMADAVFGVQQEGYVSGFGSDADHLKATVDIDNCLAAGFTMFTVDPGEHVDNSADGLDVAALNERAGKIPWDKLESSLQETISRYAKSVNLPGDVKLDATPENVLRAVVKYGKAVAHTLSMFRHLANKSEPGTFELEVSVDETEAPTTVFEHFYFASELKRLGVDWVSLAPRYIGRFEKGVDYIGDLKALAKELKCHAAVMRGVGPYKMSIHSGSDKFSVYPIIAEIAGEFVHLKTAGTSYLAALSALARVEPEFIRRIYEFARSRYETDKATYHVSADLKKTPEPKSVKDKELAALIDEFNARQVFHVTFGSVLTAKDPGGKFLFRDDLYALLRKHENVHLQVLAEHIKKHLKSFKRA